MLLRFVSIWLCIVPLMLSSGNGLPSQQITPNRGFIDMKPGTLKAGDSFDRFGGKIDPVTGKFVDTGRFVAPFGADFGGRALPQTHLDGDPVTGEKPEFKGYKILKDIPVTEGDAIPWFGQPGGGKQYELPKGGIEKLIADGYIVEITAPNLHGKTEGGDGNTNDTNNVDGGDVTTNDTNNTDGGGMRGPEVYPTAPVGERVMDMTPAEIAQAVQDAAGRKGRLPEGAKVTPTTTPGTFTMSFPDPANPKKTKSIELVVNTDFDPKKANTGHGKDQGAAMNTITVKDGKITATVELGSNHSKADADKMMVHELGEIADIVAQIETRKAEDAKNGTTTSDADLQKLISEQQQASVFKDGGSANEADMTAHDRAVIAEINALAENARNATDAAEAKAANDKLRKLSESMGIQGLNDPRIALIEKTTGRLNGEQLAALAGMRETPPGYRWVRNSDGTLTVENLPGNDGGVMEYDSIKGEFIPKPGTKPITHPAKKTADPFGFGDQSSNMNTRKGYQEASIPRSQVVDTPVKLDPKRQAAFERIKKRLADAEIPINLKTDEGPHKAGDVLTQLEAARKLAQAERDKHAEGTDEYKNAQQAVVEISEQIGEVSSMAIVEGKIEGAEELHSSIPGNGKSGQFDLVYRGPDGTIYIIEAKGGDAGLGTKTVIDPATGEEMVLQQGSPEYRDAILKIMEKQAEATGDEKLLETVEAIRAAANSDKLQYLLGSQKVGDDGQISSDFTLNKFNNKR
ncbi:MAG: TNT domain-containing protein [Bacteroidetes bacterium]|nr:TNT domain-containing protein [Bacteroidota bacterium]